MGFKMTSIRDAHAVPIPPNIANAIDINQKETFSCILQSKHYLLYIKFVILKTILFYLAMYILIIPKYLTKIL